VDDKPDQPPIMKAKDLTQAAKAEASLAIETLRSLMKGECQASVKLAAAREVLDRGFGKPKPAKISKPRPPRPRDSGLTVIIKRPEDITAEEKAAAAATARGEL
jgi:hypothetical protein